MSHNVKPSRKFRRVIHGFTIVEMMTSMTIFSLAMMAFIYAFIFGLKQDQLVQSKLGASDESRRSFERVAREIRCANSDAIGNYYSGSFTPLINGTNLVGNAIRIYLSATNSNNIIYYFATNSDPQNCKLFRIHTGDTQGTCIASNLQNSLTFTAEDFSGIVQQNMLDKYVIHFTLDFCEYQYPKTKVGAGCYYDRYIMDFRATPHVPGGR
ncbi:MAG TPA: prepilin-type N-terminal cleavage/methylation domain-containing protein [Verrucomicrobiae bacterium]|jgi:prepilin-type N-terminal cleavage/methylation domain-containing protein|nr:prepilin-type N-terminal cleavage/methylation domain-containing protein [Verrucomicrobiae bacterium]